MKRIILSIVIILSISTATVTAQDTVKLEQKDVLMLMKQGSSYEKESEYKKAISAYEKILKSFPRHRSAKRMLDRCRAKMPKESYTTMGKVASLAKQTPDEQSITIKCENGQVRLSFLTPDMIRVHMSLTGDFPKDNLWLDNNGPYNIVTFDWPGVAYELEDEGSSYKIISGEIVVKIRKDPFLLSFYDSKGTLLTQERDDPEGGGLGFLDSYRIETMDLPKDEHFFGLGGFGGSEALLDRRGGDYKMYPEELEKPRGKSGGFPTPWFMSTRGYGIFLDSLEDQTVFRMGSNPDRYTIEVPKGKLDYYFIYGPDFGKMLNRYTDITGKPALPPKKFFGRHNMGNYVSTQENTVDVAKKFREGNFPCDNIWLHWHFGEYTNRYDGWNYDWHKQNFPNPKKMISELHKMNFELGNIETICALGGELLEEATSKDWLHSKGHRLGKNVDHTIAEASKWHADLHTPRIDEGVTMWWQDNGERARGTLENGLPAHTLYPLIWAKSLYEHLEAKGYPGYIIRARAGFAGAQRYMMPWPGDLPVGTEYLFCDLQFMRGCSLSGMPFSCADMGGYEGLGSNDDENYCRRVAQPMLIFPIASVHWGKIKKRFPWRFSEKTQEIDRFYVGLRYRLLPYIYSYAINASQTGAPLLRPLVYSEPGDANTYNRDYDFLFGNELLVAPVIEKGADKREVYLTEGSWIHYWTGKKYTGGKKVTVSAPIFGKDGLPMFVRSGAIIPMMPEMQWIYENNPDPITLDIYPKENSTTRFVMKDCEKTGSEIKSTTFECADNTTTTQINISESSVSYEMLVHIAAAPASVTADGKAIKQLEDKSAYDSSSEGWYFGAGCFPGSDNVATLNVKLGKQSGGAHKIVIEKK